ncbi:hypothetical protein V3G39_08130 [Dermatophilaceae bacterium Sec6.4]
MRTVTLTEHGISDPFTLGTADREALLELPPGRLEVHATPDPGQVRVRATSWVGAVHLPEVTIRITPRAGMANLFTMFSAGIPAGTLSQDDVGWAGHRELVDGVAAFLLAAIEDCTRRGLLHGYVHREEQLQVIRGRLLVNELAVRPWSAANPPCGYDDFTIDVPENRALADAVTRVLRWPGLPAGLRRDALRLAARFDGVTPGAPDDPRSAVTITRLNAHYEAALDIAAQATAGMTISHEEGEHRARAFLIDLEQQFRRWLGAELRARLWPTFEVLEQPRYTLDHDGRLPVRPDLLITRADRPVLVVQTRHRLRADAHSTLGDLSVGGRYPVLMHAAALRTPAALLIYANDDADADEVPAAEVLIRGTGTRLLSVPLSMAGAAQVLEAQLDEMADLVRALSGSAQVGNRMPTRGVAATR